MASDCLAGSLCYVFMLLRRPAHKAHEAHNCTNVPPAPQPAKTPLSFCDHCRGPVPDPVLCLGCRQAEYCSTNCQFNAWCVYVWYLCDNKMTFFCCFPLLYFFCRSAHYELCRENRKRPQTLQSNCAQCQQQKTYVSCQRCRLRHYCGKKCLEQHRFECQIYINWLAKSKSATTFFSRLTPDPRSLNLPFFTKLVRSICRTSAAIYKKSH